MLNNDAEKRPACDEDKENQSGNNYNSDETEERSVIDCNLNTNDS